MWALLGWKVNKEYLNIWNMNILICDCGYLNIDFIGVWQLNNSGKLVTMAPFNWSQTLRNNWTWLQLNLDDDDFHANSNDSDKIIAINQDGKNLDMMVSV